MLMNETKNVLAKVAYESYCEFSGGKSIATGDDLPKWSNLPETIKGAWKYSIQGVYNYVAESNATLPETTNNTLGDKSC